MKIRTDRRPIWPPGIAGNSSGQWLLLSAVVAALGLGVIMVLLNTAVLNGHSSLVSIALFPKNDIRDLRSASVNEAVILSGEINDNASIADKSGSFNSSYDRFVAEIGNLYQAHGALTSVRYVPHTSDVMLPNGSSVTKIANVSLVIAYYNSDTIYVENASVGTL